MRAGVAAALAFSLAACGEGNAGNVMAPDVNALSPAQIDAALGPETGNAAVSVNQQAVEDSPAEDAPAATRPTPASRETEAPEPEPAEESIDETPPDNSTTEQ